MRNGVEKITFCGIEYLNVDGVWFNWTKTVEGSSYVNVIKDSILIAELEKNFKQKKGEKMLLDKYQEFAQSTISKESTNLDILIERLKDLSNNYEDVLIPQLITAGIGLSAESGEFAEVVKKLVFQGKPLTDDVIFHLKRELGDILWYVSAACDALDTNFAEIILMNIEKLSARYPAGFDIMKSENREYGDI